MRVGTSAVQRVDLRAVAVDDDLATLQAWGELALVDAEVAVEHGEPFDRLPPVQAAVQLVDEARTIARAGSEVTISAYSFPAIPCSAAHWLTASGSSVMSADA